MGRALWCSMGCAMLLGAVACTSPRAHLFLLEDVVTESGDLAAGRAAVLVQSVSIPAEVDRPQIVIREGLNQIAINEQERWAAPLKEALPRFIASQLSRQRAGFRFTTASGATVSDSRSRLAVDVERFEVSTQSGATVVMRWTYRQSGLEPILLEGESVGRAGIEKSGFDGLVEALRRAVEQATANLAQRLPDI
jgi:uncharacterized protein